MGTFDGINEAKAQGNTKTIADGRALVRVLECEAIKGFNGLSFIAMCQILESDNADDPVRSVRKIAINGISDPKRADLALGNLKSFLAALMDADADSETPCEGHTWASLSDFLVSEAGGQWLEQNEHRIEVNSYEKLNKAGTYSYKVWSFTFAPVA